MNKRMMLLVLLLATALVGLGCESTVLGPQGQTAATYRLGELKSHVASNIDTTFAATEQAMQNLGLNITQANQNQLDAKVVARGDDDKRIIVELTALTDQATRMNIDAGSLPRARRIYQAIMDSLGQGTTAREGEPQPARPRREQAAIE